MKKIEKNDNLPNFIEVHGIENANKVNEEIYTLLRYSESRDCFIFKKRRGR